MSSPRPSRPAHPRIPRLIATDLDGTLLGANFTISRRTAKTLAQAAEAGALIVLVTGRPVRWMSMVYEQLDGAYHAICANGAVSYDPATDTVHGSWPLAPAVLAEVCARLVEAIPDICFAVEIDAGRRMLHEPAYPVVWDSAQTGAGEAPLADLVAQSAVKLLARREGRAPDEFAALVDETVAGLVEVTHSSFNSLVEISARGVNKATGLAALGAGLGIGPADVLAFGDMPNDVPMLLWAGRGVAVANAHPAARAAADDHTLSNMDDGVAAYLARYL